MSPQVEAAWIAGASGLLGVIVGVAGTTIVAVVGFRNTKRASEATNQTTTNITTATIAAARGDRLYDKRAEVYVDLLVLMYYQHERRGHMRIAAAAGEFDFKVELDPVPVDWHMIEARLQAFGTVEVFTLEQAYSATAGAAEVAWLTRRGVGGLASCTTAVLAADKAAENLIEQVRLELIGPGPRVPGYRRPAD
jgi:hypothetical protein